MTRATVLPAAAALLFAAIAAAQTTATGTFTPNLSNDTVILCQGWSDEELGQILSGFRSTYRSGLGPVFSLNTHALTQSEMRISFPHDISPRLLVILVNYLQYPPGLDAGGRSIAVLGRVTLTSAYPLPNPAYAGQVARVYVPADDRRRDVVYFAVNGEFFEESLADGSAKTVSDARIPSGVRPLW
ncbi:MAG TPA: hypothetical protein VH109_11510 [Steroidobacteraceae bacterium]|jgi:hypothetical protein|nr:hypothetical protein [Steroidobacteraceae bacterium]